ncbi:GyrI-like domain-containing protein [Paenibacillus tarimensis]
MRRKNPDLWKEHTSIVNRVIDLIDERLETNLTLESIASEVAVSPYHLHRMFTKVTGESLQQHIIRNRIQRAAHHLLYARPLTISEIAYRCGFSSLSIFSRAFKHVMGEGPERFREQHALIKSKICKIENKDWERYFIKYPYNGSQGDGIEGTYHLRVSVREFPTKEICYIRHFGYRHYAKLDFDIDRSLTSLSLMATRMELWTSGTYLLGIPRYSLMNVPSLQIGYDACLTSPRKIQVFGEIGSRTLQGGKYAVLHLEEPNEAVEPFVQMLLNSWLPESGYSYALRPTMIICYNSPSLHPERKWIVDVCLPIE